MAQDAEASSFWDFKGEVDYVDEWFLMGSPIPMLLIWGAYLLFVLKLGPMYMKNRPAYQLKNLLLIYNIFQVAFSIYICTIGISAFMEFGLIEKEKCFMTDEKIKLTITRGQHVYFIAKLTEFTDTIFFVLRKKWNQISFLHVYHHSIMYLAVWTSLKYETSFTLVFLGTLNSLVHVIMYTYYGLSAFPQLERYLWWKKYITKLQLIQFLMILIQVQVNYILTPCPMSYFLLTLCWSHTILFIYLFMDFYIKSYREKRRLSQASVSEKKDSKSQS